jgi:LPXTG-motif cell wall-anchored protein
VAPTTSTTAPVQPSVGAELPKTGSDNDALLIAAGIALLVGGASLLASNRLARRPQS